MGPQIYTLTTDYNMVYEFLCMRSKLGRRLLGIRESVINLESSVHWPPSKLHAMNACRVCVCVCVRGNVCTAMARIIQ